MGATDLSWYERLAWLTSGDPEPGPKRCTAVHSFQSVDPEVDADVSLENVRESPNCIEK